MTIELILRTAVLVVMGTISVSLWTVRVALTARARRLAAAAAAGVEAVVFALVFTSVMSSLNSPVEVAGYAVGVAAGTLLGVVADTRLSTGQSAVRVVASGTGERLVSLLRGKGWPVTALRADGVGGDAAMLIVAVDDSRLPRLLGDLLEMAPDAFWTVERLQAAKSSTLPAGYHQLRARRTGRPSRRIGVAGPAEAPRQSRSPRRAHHPRTRRRNMDGRRAGAVSPAACGSVG